MRSRSSKETRWLWQHGRANRRTGSSIPATRKEQEAARVSECSPSQPGCCPHRHWLCGFSSQCTEFLWPEFLVSFMYEHIYWVCTKGIHQLLELTLGKHGQYGLWAGTTLNSVPKGILQ